MLISSLIPLSHSIRVFSAKWQSIRYKFEELFSNLTAIEKWESADNVNLSLPSILATLKECDGLAKQCLHFSYSGKLLLQSDLDIVSSKIDAHIKNIFDIYAVGLLTRSDAIVVSRPSASSSTDDVRFYVVDLLSRFKIGSTDMKKQALVAFNEVIQEDETYMEVALQLDDFIGFLVNFLDFKDGEIQEEASKSVCLIAGLNSYKSELIGAGAIAPLIRVVESGSEVSREFAARCLLKVTENSDNAWSVSAHGGVTALLKICGGGGGGELSALACAVLKNLVGVHEIKRFVVEEGGIGELVDLAKSKDEVIKISSLDLLQTMAYGDESIRDMIIHEGGVRVLVRAFCPKSTFTAKTREMAFRGIVNICCSSENSLHLLINYGFTDHVLYFLRYGELSVQELALKAAFWLSGTSVEGNKVMGDAGFMAILVRFLDSKSTEIREIAAETISSMIMVPKNRRKFVQNDQNLGLLLQMLDPGETNSGNKKLLLSILMSLTRSNSARKKIANSGYLKNIEKLAEAQVSDAKKIVRKISSTRLGSILHGIWHS